MGKEIRLNAFDMNCVGHQSPGLWKHPKDRSATYKDLEYWSELALILEKGKFDGLFIADVLGVYDVYHGTAEHAIRNATRIPLNDPLLVVPAMALVTEHLGFGVTCSLTYEHPYHSRAGCRLWTISPKDEQDGILSLPISIARPVILG
jgi:alkanesulfonate monooxygenase SsuD/methylene tetrahydromethanopterin reductase-like flavin-dependent oxidoreductase (luciferase family)